MLGACHVLLLSSINDRRALQYRRKKIEYYSFSTHSLPIMMSSSGIEIKANSAGLVGLYATQNFSPGDMLLSELPSLITCAYTTEQIEALASQFDFDFSNMAPGVGLEKKRPAVASNSVKKKSTPAKGSKPPVGYSEKIQGMLGAAAAFALLPEDNEELRTRILSLFHPSLTVPRPEEQPIVRQAREALQFCRKHAKGSSFLHTLLSTSQGEEAVVKAMLIWSCNAFEGGLIYGIMSRANHSCDPNSVYGPLPSASMSTTRSAFSAGSLPEQHRQVIRAVTNIAVGEQITVSYLGIFLWAGRDTRRERLLQTKHFACQCSRCSQGDDIASAFPCPHCHKRVGKRLDEHVIWEEMNVSYIYPKNTVDETTNGADVMECSHCHQTTPLNCPDLALMKKICDKVTARLMSASMTLLNASSNAGDASEDMTVQLEIDEQLYQVSPLRFMHYLSCVSKQADVLESDTDVFASLVVPLFVLFVLDGCLHRGSKALDYKSYALVYS